MDHISACAGGCLAGYEQAACTPCEEGSLKRLPGGDTVCSPCAQTIFPTISNPSGTMYDPARSVTAGTASVRYEDCGCSAESFLPYYSRSLPEGDEYSMELHRICPQADHHDFAWAESYLPFIEECCPGVTREDAEAVGAAEACPEPKDRDCLVVKCKGQVLAGRKDNVTLTAPCKTCPAGTICVDPLQRIEGLQIKKGFWRANEYSDVVMECPEGENACIGSGNRGSHTTPDRLCGENRYGPYCDVCYPLHFKTVNMTCERCVGAFSMVGEGDWSAWLPAVILGVSACTT